ncbi:hypothetical protein IW262DRAFT_220373 [Armillaria fumosa]|nr:hypothetical protein IW262DRAFT_220373 [Armillaria fumosa]
MRHLLFHASLGHALYINASNCPLRRLVFLSSLHRAQTLVTILSARRRDSSRDISLPGNIIRIVKFSSMPQDHASVPTTITAVDTRYACGYPASSKGLLARSGLGNDDKKHLPTFAHDAQRPQTPCRINPKPLPFSGRNSSKLLSLSLPPVATNTQKMHPSDKCISAVKGPRIKAQSN